MSPRHIVVVGASLAGLRAVETLRSEGHDGRITLIGDESALPYDRPPLSKEVLVGSRTPESTHLLSEAELDDLEIDPLLGTAATRLDLARRTLLLDEDRLQFDGLIIATGASPRRLEKLERWEGVHLLRSLDDAVGLRAALESAHAVVIVGAGFIGSEVAASARALGLDVTVVEAAPSPLARALGTEMGARCGELHGEHGTDLRCSTFIERIEGAGRVERVHLSDGTALEADVVVVGVGAKPNTDWLQQSGITIADGVLCDATLNTGHPAVYAAGDVASWMNELFGQRMRCEQWTNAREQARHAARNLLRQGDRPDPFRGSNYFWSDQYGVRLQFVGSPRADEVQLVDGDRTSRSWLAWYRHGDRLVGALAMDAPKLLSASRRLIEAQASWQTALGGLASTHAAEPATRLGT